MALRDQVLDRAAGAPDVVADDGVDRGVLRVRVDEDRRRPVHQRRRRPVAQVGADDDQPVGRPLGDQPRHLDRVVVRVDRHRREQQVDLADPAQLLDPGHHRGVEAVGLGRVADRRLDDQPDRHRLHRRRGRPGHAAIADPARRRQHAVAGLAADPLLAADRERRRRRRDAGLARHVRQGHLPPGLVVADRARLHPWIRVVARIMPDGNEQFHVNVQVRAAAARSGRHVRRSWRMATHPPRRAADLLVDCLAAEGCEYVFSVPGEETMDVLDALSRRRRSGTSPRATSRARRSWPTSTAG